MSVKRFGNFDVGEILFVAENMDCHTRVYVEAARDAARRRAKKSPECKSAAETMTTALKTQPPEWFDSAVDWHDRER